MENEPKIIEGTAEPVTTTAVTAYEPPGVPAHPFDVDPASFALQIQKRGENYQALVDWLLEHMIDGEDVIQIHVVKAANCNNGGPPPKGDCTPETTPYHFSDPDLSKKGAEKVCGLLGLGTRFLGMDDFKRAALKGYELKHIIIDCELYNASGAAVSQGTGACSLEEVYGSLNSAMKKAAKRAHVDAVKRCAGLSGLATEIKRRMGPVDLDKTRRDARTQAAETRLEGGRAPYASGRPLETCPLGKHKGKPWKDVPGDYLKWICTDMDKPDIVAAAAEELERRRNANRPTEEPPEYTDDEIPY